MFKGDSIVAGGEGEADDSFGDGEEGGPKRIKYVIDSIPIYVIAERVQYYGPDGKLITESLHDYTRACVKKQFASLDDFLRCWSDAEQKKAVIEEMAAQGVMWEALAEEVEAKQGTALDPFDLICHVAFDQPALTRQERADQVKKRNYFGKYSGAARQVLEALLDKYADTGIEHIEDIKILQLDPFSQIGAPIELVKAFGGKPGYQKAIQALEQELYA
jgi:type I restriction enzyme R subunit